MTSDPGGGAVSGRAARRLGARWAIATGATIVILAAVAALIFAAQRPSASPILPYVPGNAIAYAEARLDTPGDQGQALASFLAHFPGFADTSNLQVKLGETWDRLVAGLTGNRYRYSTDIAPWAEGTVGVAALPASATGRREPGVVVLVAVKDQARAQAELDKVVASVAPRGTRAEVGGTTAWTMDNGQAVLALLPSGMFVIASDTGTVAAVADARAGKTANLGAAKAYLDASAGSASDRLGSVYLSTSAVGSQLRSLMPSIAPAVTACGGTADPLSALPVSMFGTLRAEQDGVVVDVRVRPSPAAAPAAHASTLVDHVPATTLAYVEVHDLGKALSGGICGLKAGMAASASQAPGASSAPVDQQVRQIEGILGGPLESFVSWMGDGGIAVGAPLADQSTPSVVFVASATDVSAATQRLSQLKGLLELAGSFGATGLAVSDERHGAATITMLTVPASVVTGGSSGTALPASVSVSWTLSGGVFVLSLSPGAVARVLDLQTAQSLGATPAFRDALAAVGGPSVTSIAYVDLRATRAAVEATAGLPSTYATDVKPYLLPFDRFVAAGTVQDGTPAIRAVITVSNPQ
jgi:hypothetical protein